jgi:coenzyme F420-0:L-glutamate ligase/coenzyme F420-1:gamma-L-glutamate ligase
MSCVTLKDVLIVTHRLGFVVANAGVDQSNIDHPDATSAHCCCRGNPDASVRRAQGSAGRSF